MLWSFGAFSDFFELCFFPMRNGFTAYIFNNLKKTELHAQV